MMYSSFVLGKIKIQDILSCSFLDDLLEVREVVIAVEILFLYILSGLYESSTHPFLKLRKFNTRFCWAREGDWAGEGVL